MKFINKYRVVFAVVLPLLILVLIRSFGTNHFREDAKKWAGPTFNRSNIVSRDQLNAIQGNKLIVNLDEKATNVSGIMNNQISVAPADILKSDNLKTIRKHKGPIFLCSADHGISARIWMVLSQMGFRNIFILADDSDNEVLKYKFRPDTTTGPESVK
jgi:hypothetical protein